MSHYIFQSFNAEFKALMTPVTFQFADDAGGDIQLHNIPTEYWWVFQKLIVSSADKLFQDKNCHHRVFGLDGPKTISNLSAYAERPLDKSVIFQTLFATRQSSRRRGKKLLWVKTEHSSCWIEPTKQTKMCFFLSVVCCKAFILSSVGRYGGLLKVKLFPL